MTDRELLELAAKAAGHEVWTDIDGALYTGEPERTWNPLTDDGDALRLAVKLDIVVAPSKKYKEALIGVSVNNEGQNISEVYNDDPCAATRRAIVRAAAEIAKAMP